MRHQACQTSTDLLVSAVCEIFTPVMRPDPKRWGAGEGVLTNSPLETWKVVESGRRYCVALRGFVSKRELKLFLGNTFNFGGNEPQRLACLDRQNATFYFILIFFKRITSGLPLVFQWYDVQDVCYLFGTYIHTKTVLNQLMYLLWT